MTYAEMYDKIKDIKNEDIPEEMLTFCKFLMSIRMDSQDIAGALELLGDTQGLSDAVYDNVWNVLIPSLRAAEFIDTPLGKVFAEAAKYERNNNEFYTVDMGEFSLTANHVQDDIDKLIESKKKDGGEDRGELPGEEVVSGDLISEDTPVFEYVFEDWAAYRDWAIVGKMKIPDGNLVKIGREYLLRKVNTDTDCWKNVTRSKVEKYGLIEKFGKCQTLSVCREYLKPLLESRDLLEEGCNSTKQYHDVILDAHSIFELLALEYPGLHYCFSLDRSCPLRIRLDVTGVDPERWSEVDDAVTGVENKVVGGSDRPYSFIHYVSEF